jgi:hypothetical protein
MFCSMSSFAHQIPLEVRVLRSIDIGECLPGDRPKLIRPGDPEAAQIQILGPAHESFQLILPAGPISLLTTGPGAVKTIELGSFTSSMAGGALNDQGQQLITLGAVRGPLSLAQAPGSYTGQMYFTVVFE